MAITQTRTVQRLEVYPGQGEEATPTIMVVYEYLFDDSEDDQLPVTTTKVKHLVKEIVGMDEEGNEITTPTDISGEDALVQTVANAVWS